MADPTSDVIRVIQEFKAGLARRDAIQVVEMTRRWVAVDQALSGQIDALAAELSQLKAQGKAVGQWQIARMQRYQDLLGQVRSEMTNYNTFAAARIEQEQLHYGITGIQEAGSALATITGSVSSSFNLLPVSSVHAMVGLAGDGSPLLKLLQASWPAATQQLTQALVNGMAMGWHPSKTAKAMRDAMNGEGLGRAITIARTEQLRVWRASSLGSYRESKRVTGYHRLAARDVRTCLACLMDDGHYYDIKEDFSDHPVGRCTCVPELSGHPAQTWETGQQWFEKLPEDQQKAMMGPGLFTAWKEGKFTLPDLVKKTHDPTWGGSLGVRSLTELTSPGFRSTPLTPMLPPKPAPKPAKPKAPKVVEPAAWPTKPADVKVIKGLGGSTGAQLVQDPATGRMFVMKRGKDAGHLLEETYADATYQAMGVKVPAFKVYKTTDGPVKLAEFIKGKTLKQAMNDMTPAELKKVYAQLQKDFAADAFMGNRDVIGMEFDNVLIDEKGVVWRIDNGGSLRRRAQGDLKAGGWDPHPMELWTLRNPKVNAQTATVFEGIGMDDLTSQIDGITAKRQAIIAALPKDLESAAVARLDRMEDIAKVAKTLRADKFTEEYVDGFTYHSANLHKTGLIDRLPKMLTSTPKKVLEKGDYINPTTVYDEKGKLWDSLRGTKSVVFDINEYINKGGKYGVIEEWMGQQAGSSWSNPSQAVKAFFAQQRAVPLDNYWWREGVSVAKNALSAISSRVGGKDVYRTTMQAWHAWNYEILRTVEFANNDHAAGMVRLIRTESKSVMQKLGVQRGATGIIMKRGAAESASIFSEVSVGGSEITVQQVPHQRVLAMYFYERTPGSKQCCLYGDAENEFVAMLENLPVNYTRPA